MGKGQALSDFKSLLQALILTFATLVAAQDDCTGDDCDDGKTPNILPVALSTAVVIFLVLLAAILICFFIDRKKRLNKVFDTPMTSFDALNEGRQAAFDVDEILAKAEHMYRTKFAKLLDGSSAEGELRDLTFDDLSVGHSSLKFSGGVLGQGQYGTVYLATVQTKDVHPALAESLQEPSGLGATTSTTALVGYGGGGGGGRAALGRSVKVAVKTVSLVQAGQEEEVIRLLLEARAMSALRHPNLLLMLGICYERMPVLLLTEYCDLGDLKTYLTSKRGLRMTVGDKVFVLRELSAALGHLHKHGIIHRDVAARNVLLRSAGRGERRMGVKLADLGMARAVQSDYYKAYSDDAVPIKWQCPIAVTTRSYTVKSDIWSFGVVIWETFAQGQTPYSGKSALQVIRFLQQGSRLEQPAACPREIFEVALQCMQGQPQARPSAEEAGQALQEALTRHEASAAAAGEAGAMVNGTELNGIGSMGGGVPGAMFAGDDAGETKV